MPAGVPSLPLSVPGGLFLAPLGSSVPSSIGFHAHQALYGSSPRSNGHVELFQRSSLPSGGSLPLKLPRSGAAPDKNCSLPLCDRPVDTSVRGCPCRTPTSFLYRTSGTCIQDEAGSSVHCIATFSIVFFLSVLGASMDGLAKVSKGTETALALRSSSSAWCLNFLFDAEIVQACAKQGVGLTICMA